jgi:hypothetical protein
VFGSDICTCRPYLIYGIEEAVKEVLSYQSTKHPLRVADIGAKAQKGGSGVVIYFRKEGRALGEVTKVKVFMNGSRQLQPLIYCQLLNPFQTLLHIPHHTPFHSLHIPHPHALPCFPAYPQSLVCFSRDCFLIPCCSTLSTMPESVDLIVPRSTSSEPRTLLV